MKNLKWVLLILVVIAAIIVTVVLLNNNSKNDPKKTTDTSSQSQIENTEVSTTTKAEQTGTAGSNIPLKDNLEEAKYQIKIAVQKLFEENYGNEVVDARINVEKVYSDEEEKANSTLAEKNLGANEVAFEVSCELKLAEGVDANKYIAGSGVYDEQTGWVKEIHRVGILVPNDGGEPKYKVTNFGTGW